VLIKNYGLFWNRNDVFWGGVGPGNSGTLLGKLFTTDKPTDFRDQQGIYVLYDDNFRMVYVGQAGSKDNRLFDRLKQHRSDDVADRWTKFSWFGLKWVTKENKLSADKGGNTAKIPAVLNHLEAILIAAAEPIHNKQGGRFTEECKKYFQYRELKPVELSASEMLKEVYEYCKTKK
jgi:hypothetical protein